MNMGVSRNPAVRILCMVVGFIFSWFMLLMWRIRSRNDEYVRFYEIGRVADAESGLVMLFANNDHPVHYVDRREFFWICDAFQINGGLVVGVTVDA